MVSSFGMFESHVRVAFARALCASGETKGAVQLQKRTLREVRADLGPLQLRRAPGWVEQGSREALTLIDL